jgi:hypothetical protein
MSENEKSAAGYIVTFFNDIESVTNSLGYYSNAMAMIKGKYPAAELNKILDEEKNQMLATVQDIRFWVIRTYVKFNALKGKIKEFETFSKNIDKYYGKILEQPVPTFESLNGYVVELNRLFVLGIVESILTKAYDVYAKYAGK